MTYPLALYREGEGRDAFKWDGRMTEMLTVADSEEHEAALADGWSESADYLATEQQSLSLLDQNAAAIIQVLPELTLEELEALKADETAGKTRKGVLASIDEAIDAKLRD